MGPQSVWAARASGGGCPKKPQRITAITAVYIYMYIYYKRCNYVYCFTYGTFASI